MDCSSFSYPNGGTMQLDHSTNSLLKRPVDIADFAFFQGAQEIPIEETQKEIEALHDRQKARLVEESIPRQKPLEAIVGKLTRRRPDVERAWDEVRERLGNHSPAVFTAFLVAGLGVAALVIDSLLLGPGLDAVGISEPILQFIAAFGLAALSSLIFHLAHETFSNRKIDKATAIVWRILAGFAVIALLAWGILRGLQVRFAANLNGNPLGGFLGQHPILSSIFFCFVTLAAPLVGAAAIYYAAPRIHDALQWRHAKREHDNLNSKLTDAEKKLEAEQEELKARLSQLDAQRQTWHAQAAQYHARGDKRGGRQVPQWLVLVKAALWAVVALIPGILLGLPVLITVALPVVAGIAGFLFYRHRRFHPSYKQFKRQENVRFAVSTDRPSVEMPPTQRLLQAPWEDRP
jgi:Flp pilus assembly protein TadB